MMSDGTLKGYVFINFEGNEYVIDYKVAGFSKEYQVEVFAPTVMEQATLTYGVENGHWKEMQYQREYDPAFIHSLRNGATARN